MRRRWRGRLEVAVVDGEARESPGPTEEHVLQHVSYRRALIAGVLSVAVTVPVAAVPASEDLGAVSGWGAAPAEAGPLVYGSVTVGAPVRTLDAAAVARVEAAVAKRAASVARSTASRASATRAVKRAAVVAGKRSAVVAAVHARRGKPYRYGAKGPGAYDCSGLALVAFRAAGVHLPHQAAAQARRGRPISRAQVQPGDGAYYGQPAYHAAVVVRVQGRKVWVVDALNPSEGIRVRRANYAGSPRFVRFIG